MLAQGDTHDGDAYDPLVQGALLSAPLGVPSSSLNQLQVPVIPPTPTTTTTTTQGSPPPSSEPSISGTFMTTTSPTTATETAHTTTSTTATPSSTHGPTSDACILKAVYSIISVSLFLFMYAIV
ncbi:predicted protein [Lichtheimia corymbifera JMRC:FSU:9682]|uniref:Uncharacterized protein n=1 Tax=Lichtheimia corymbifera JMRC:FSU:9682 TaxID=1263082 RepID=A0A068S8W1_9FUNG|nr:predicted protein [Lichtheimia corymbifera JMRC:FSU:9682]